MDVVRFCRTIVPRNAQLHPCRVACRTSARARPHMCFENVRHHCDRHAGSLRTGWVLWEWKDTFLEAEHHAVWHNGADYIDITPHQPQWNEILFLPDPDATFDFIGHRRMDNHRLSLRDDRVVKEYLALAARLINLEETNSSGTVVVFGPDQSFTAAKMRERLRQLEIQLAEWSVRNTGRNDPCWCGSGVKSKKCCDMAGSSGRAQPERFCRQYSSPETS